MNQNDTIKTTGAALLALFAAVSQAAVSPEEAKQLGGAVLTEFGAERAGNKDGSIPAYTGERVKTAANYDPAEPGQLPDPFNDKPLFSITAQNVGQHADKLSETQKAMLATYPGYRLDVYSSRRTAYFPKYVIDNTLKNATSCKGENGELSLSGCYGGIMFPIPKTGNQVMWNHVTRYVGHAWLLDIKSVYVTPDGTPVVQGHSKIHQEFSIYDPSKAGQVLPGDTLYYKFRLDQVGPARRIGERIVYLYPLDPISIGARIYQYLPGQRRVKLAPDLSYDTPNPQSGGAATSDETSLFSGAQDRYDFKLAGKKDIYMLYNNYNATDGKKCPDEAFFKKGFANPDCMRWELHRSWVVNATLKPGYRHIYPKRSFYFDEDTWAPGNADNFDASGGLFRGDFVPHSAYYLDSAWPMHNNSLPTYVVDLKSGAWYTTQHAAYPGGGVVPEKARPASYFSPDALAGQGIR